MFSMNISVIVVAFLTACTFKWKMCTDGWMLHLSLCDIKTKSII